MFNHYAKDLQTALSALSKEKVHEARSILAAAKSQNASVYIMGNGGSAATSSHFANDLVKCCGIRAVSMPDAVPIMTAYGNDNGWENMYADYLRAMLLPQDVVIGISCSGNSANIVTAIRTAKEHHLPSLKTLVFTGADVNCQLAKLIPNVVIYVPFRDIRVQEDCHLAICHALVGMLDGKSA